MQNVVLYLEKQNIYNKCGVWFLVLSVVFMMGILMLYDSQGIEDYIMFGSIASFLLGIQTIVSLRDFYIGYNDEQIIYGYKKELAIPYSAIKRVWIENIDYTGRFGGVGKRTNAKIAAYTFVDTGDFICIETAKKTYYFSIKEKETWLNWLDQFDQHNK